MVMNPSSSIESVVVSCAHDVTELVNDGRASFEHPVAILVLALGGLFVDAYSFTSIGFGLPAIRDQFQLGDAMLGLVGASIMIGALLGALAGGYLIDRIGRYRVFMADMLLLAIMTVASGLAPDVWSLIVFRFVLGFALGVDSPAAMALVAEYSSLAAKGTHLTMSQPVWYIATSSTYALLLVLFFLVPTPSLWRWALALGAVPCLVIFVMRGRYMSESPLWLAAQGDLAGAAAIISARGNVRVVVAPWAAPVARRAETPAKPGFRSLLDPPYFLRTVQASALGVFQSAEYYAVGFSLPLIMFHLFGKGDLTVISVSLAINALFGITGAWIGVKTIAKLGSLRLAMIGFLVTCLCLIALGAVGTPGTRPAFLLSAALLAVFVMAHSFGPGSQSGVQMTLSYPTALRGIGSGVGNAIDRVGSIAGLFMFPILAAQFGSRVFLLIAAAPALGLLVLGLIRWDPTRVDVEQEKV